MNQRAAQLHTMVDGQLQRMIEMTSAAAPAALVRPCPGREKLGDGSVGALAAHTADNYLRIAELLVPGDLLVAGTRGGGGHRIPRLARAIGHRPPARHASTSGQRPPAGPARSTHDGSTHDGDHDAGMQYSARDGRPDEIAPRLNLARERFGALAQLTDDRLDWVPPKGSFRFCDGERTLEQVLASLFKHQDHQLQALSDALS